MNLVVLLLCVSELIDLLRILSLVAHVVGYKMIVGAHNTINVRRMWEVFTMFSM